MSVPPKPTPLVLRLIVVLPTIVTVPLMVPPEVEAISAPSLERITLAVTLPTDRSRKEPAPVTETVAAPEPKPPALVNLSVVLVPVTKTLPVLV